MSFLSDAANKTAKSATGIKNNAIDSVKGIIDNTTDTAKGIIDGITGGGNSGSGTGGQGKNNGSGTGGQDSNNGGDKGDGNTDIGPTIDGINGILPKLPGTDIISLGLRIVKVLNVIIKKIGDVQTKIKEVLTNIKNLVQKVVNDVLRVIQGKGTVGDIDVSVASIPVLAKLAIQQIYNDGIDLGSVVMSLERKVLAFGVITVPKKIISIPISIIDKIITSTSKR